MKQLLRLIVHLVGIDERLRQFLIQVARLVHQIGEDFHQIVRDLLLFLAEYARNQSANRSHHGADGRSYARNDRADGRAGQCPRSRPFDYVVAVDGIAQFGVCLPLVQLADGLGITVHCVIERPEAVFDLAGIVAHKGARLALQAQLLIER